MKVSVCPEWGVSSAVEPGAVRRTFWFPADRSAFAQEPVFVPGGGAAAEDDGWVLTLLYSAAEDRTSLVGTRRMRTDMRKVANAVFLRVAGNVCEQHGRRRLAFVAAAQEGK